MLLSGNQRKIAEWRRQEAGAPHRRGGRIFTQATRRLMSCKKVLAGDKAAVRGYDRADCARAGAPCFCRRENICLRRDKVSGAYFHTAEGHQSWFAGCLKSCRRTPGGGGLLVLHQEFVTEPAEKYLRFRTAMTCNQIVYTKHEKLPVTGLYRMDGKPARKRCVVIRPLYDGTLRRGWCAITIRYRMRRM